MRHLIGILIPAEYQIDFPIEVEEFLNRFKIVRRIVPTDQDGIVFHVEHPNAPEIGVGYTIQIRIPKMINTEYMRILYL